MPKAPETVLIRKRKRPVGEGLWAAYVLAEDDHGLWLHTPAHSRYEGWDGTTFGVCELAQDPNGIGRPIVQLIPSAGWWIAEWLPDTAKLQVAVDVCKPPALKDQTWTYIDLELDPYRTQSGTVNTEDWDEFEDACTSGVISADEAHAARAATADLERWMTDRIEPFGVVGPRYLAEATALELPPLVDVMRADEISSQ